MTLKHRLVFSKSTWREGAASPRSRLAHLYRRHLRLPLFPSLSSLSARLTYITTGDESLANKGQLLMAFLERGRLAWGRIKVTITTMPSDGERAFIVVEVATRGSKGDRRWAAVWSGFASYNHISTVRFDPTRR